MLGLVCGRKSLSILLLIVGVTAGTETKADQPTVTINTFVGTVGPLQIALANGLCEKHGLKCKTVSVGSTPLAVQALIGGSVDLVSGSTDVIIQAAIRGTAVRIVWGERRINPFFVATHKQFNLPSRKAGYPEVMKDFKGAKVGVSARGASTETQFVALLQGAGLQASDVTFVAVGGQNTALAALRSRQVDAIMTWEPAGLICEQDDLCNVAVDLRKDEGPAFLTALTGAQTVFAMRDSYIQENPNIVEALLQVFSEADMWMHNPENAEALLEIHRANMKIPNQADLDGLLRKYMQNTTLAGYSIKLDPRAVQAAADYLFETKQTPKRFDATKLIWDKAPKQ